MITSTSSSWHMLLLHRQMFDFYVYLFGCLLQLLMGNAAEVCRNDVVEDHEIVVKPGDDIVTLTKTDKLEPITFDHEDNRTPHSPIQKEKIDIRVEYTPPKRNAAPSDEISPHENKVASAKKSKLDLNSMVVLSPHSHDSNHIIDQLIDVPYSVIRLTMTDRLHHAIFELGSEIFTKYQKDDKKVVKWKLHKKGFYITRLGEGLFGLLTNTYYYEGELQQKNEAIIPVGDGVLITQNGLYSGSFKQGKANGKGTFKDVDFKATYKGTWRDGILQEGSIENEMFKFQGKFQNGVAQGSGKMQFKQSGYAYTGQFDDGLFHDKNGFLEGRNYIYEGGFENGRKEGEGCLVQKEQAVRDKKQKYRPAQQFQGKWHHDSFEGRPTVYSKIVSGRK